MPTATVHLMRHGEVHNPDGILYGRLPGFHLSERGYAMADRLAEHFSARRAEGAKLVLVVASPLLRAQETATPTANALGLEIQTDPRVIEAGNHFEGLKVSPRELRKPRHWPYFVNPLRPSWGESYKSQVSRVMAAVQDARAKALELGGPGAEAVIVSHQLPIWSTRLAAENRRLAHDPRNRECTLTSLTSLEFDEQGVVQQVRYTEPAADLLIGASTTPGA